MNQAETFTIDEIEEKTGFDRRTIAYYVQQGLLPKVGRRGPRTRYSQLFVDRLHFIRTIRDLQDRGMLGTMTLADIRDFFDSVPEETIADVVDGRQPPPTVGQQGPGEGQAMAPPSERRTILARTIEGLRDTAVNESIPAPLQMRGRSLERAQEEPRRSELDQGLAGRARPASPDTPGSAQDRDSPSGEYHRLTLDAIERRPGARTPEPRTVPSPPAEDELREALARLSAVVRRHPRAYLRTTESWTRARVSEELAFVARGLEQRYLPLLERVAQILRRLLREGEGGI
jgi:DNA-binding transcriptional MerR regulator